MDIRARGLSQVAVTAIFSPLTDEDEMAVAKIVQDAVPDVSVTCSHMLGGIGLLERENAAILNAAIIPLAHSTIRGFERAMREAGIEAPLYITQNDGTVAAADHAARFPVFSFASGPTNSMRGAANLFGMSDAIVADVGGTTTDFGHLQAGFPRQANSTVQVGGVRTLFRMPDVFSIGFGGGSLVNPDTLKIGPRSVEAGDVTLIAVGGGAFLIPERLSGVREVVRLDHGGCANAVGAAIAQVSGEVDQVFQGLRREEALAQARALAEDRAVDAGAVHNSLSLVEAEDIPIAYLPGDAIRVRVKVVGDIA